VSGFRKGFNKVRGGLFWRSAVLVGGEGKSQEKRSGSISEELRQKIRPALPFTGKASLISSDTAQVEREKVQEAKERKKGKGTSLTGPVQTRRTAGGCKVR